MSTFAVDQTPDGCAKPIAELFAYWRSIHPADGLPGRQHFDPTTIPRLLAHLWLLDVIGTPPRFRYRVVGTAIARFTGHDNTGLWCDDVHEDFRHTDAYRCAHDCAATGRPQYRKSDALSNPARDDTLAEWLYLPLASDGRHVDILLNMTIYRAKPPAALDN